MRTTGQGGALLTFLSSGYNDALSSLDRLATAMNNAATGVQEIPRIDEAWLNQQLCLILFGCWKDIYETGGDMLAEQQYAQGDYLPWQFLLVDSINIIKDIYSHNFDLTPEPEQIVSSFNMDDETSGCKKTDVFRLDTYHDFFAPKGNWEA